MKASVIWYRARPSDEFQERIRAMLFTVRAEAAEENMTIRADQIPAMLASAIRGCDITVTVGGMDLRKDEENIVFLTAKCIRTALETGRHSRSRYIYDPMRSARLPSFEDAVLFPSASGGAEGAVLSTGGQTIIMLPRLEESNLDIIDLIAEYLPMIIGLPEEPEPEPEEPLPHEGWTPDWEAMRAGGSEQHFYDENGNRLPEYIERVLARKGNRPVPKDRDISSSELRFLFSDDNDSPAEDNLRPYDPDEYTDDTELLFVPQNNPQPAKKKAPEKKLSPWEQMFEEAKEGSSRIMAARRYEELLSSQPAEESGRHRFTRRNAPAPAAEPIPEPIAAEEPKPAAVLRTRREPQPLASAVRRERTPDVSMQLKNVYRPAQSARRGAVLPEPPASNQKTLGQRAAPALRASAILLIISIIISACYIAFNSYESGIIEPTVYYQSELASLYGNEDTDRGDLPFGASARFAALYAENNDVCGYISIPGTDIAQPVMRSYSSSPDFYANYSFYGRPDSRGSLYFDSGNVFEWGESNYNLVVYGNSPIDGSMFSSLHRYTEAEYLSAHPLINLDTLYEQGQWIIFAVCLVSGDTVSEFNYRDTDFYGQYSRQIHLYNLYIRSMFYTNTEVLPDEKILTLITDSDTFDGAKLLVCARKVRDGEDLSQAGKSVIANNNAIMPDLWYVLNNTDMPSVPRLELPTEAPTTAYTTLTTTTTTTTTAATRPGETTTTTTTAPTVATEPTTLEPSTAERMRITSGGKIIEGKAEDILAMIIEAEMGSTYHLEALKAQAVASYTYYLYAGGSAKAPGFSTKTAGERALQAASEVVGQYMFHDGIVPYTPYFATSAGMTADNEDINGTALSWLPSVDCGVDRNTAGFTTVKQASSTVVAQKVKEAKGIDLTAIADKSQWFEVLERDANGLYVTSVRVGEQIFRGSTLHLSILGYSYLRSSCFQIEYDSSSDMFIFTSQGYGTGVGMSQTGANEYALMGHNYVWILQHFYPGVTLKSN